MHLFNKIIFSGKEALLVIINLKKMKDHVSKLFDSLSHEEKTIANNFLFDHLKKRYTISRGVLRFLLGKFLALPAEKVEFDYNEFKKPLSAQNPNLYFNVSHSQDISCYGFFMNNPIGVDIEFMDDKIELDSILPFITSPAEALIFNNISVKGKVFLFYKMWTIKEAYLKALGIGLTLPLTNIETTILPKEKFEVIKDLNTCEEEAASDWTFLPINSIHGYLGSVVIKKPNVSLHIITLDPSHCF
jgi:4'-phosphopantetheinyl transferase